MLYYFFSIVLGIICSFLMHTGDSHVLTVILHGGR